MISDKSIVLIEVQCLRAAAAPDYEKTQQEFERADTLHLISPLLLKE